ncbi:hypothetical protein BDV06DRAFT_225162 [Aspergillus oleicola]
MVLRHHLVTEVTAAQILGDPLPKLFNSKDYCTTSDAYQKKYFNGEIVPWQIKQEAKLNGVFSEENMTKKLFAVRLQENAGTPIFINREQFIVSDEQSLCGRFVQNALVPVTVVAFENGIMSRLSDFKGCAASGNRKTRRAISKKNKDNGKDKQAAKQARRKGNKRKSPQKSQKSGKTSTDGKKAVDAAKDEASEGSEKEAGKTDAEDEDAKKKANLHHIPDLWRFDAMRCFRRRGTSQSLLS